MLTHLRHFEITDIWAQSVPKYLQNFAIIIFKPDIGQQGICYIPSVIHYMMLYYNNTAVEVTCAAFIEWPINPVTFFYLLDTKELCAFFFPEHRELIYDKSAICCFFEMVKNTAETGPKWKYFKLCNHWSSHTHALFIGVFSISTCIGHFTHFGGQNYSCYSFSFTRHKLYKQILGQILDYKGQIWLKFECNGTKKPWREIRMPSFYLRWYGSLIYFLDTKCILFDHLLYSTSPVTTELEMSLMMLILMPFSNKSAIDIGYPFFEKTLQIKLNISITYI